MDAVWSQGVGSFFDFGSVDDPNTIVPNKLMIVDEADLSLNSLVTFDR